MQNHVSNFSRGFFTVARAARFLKTNPSLAGYVVIPFTINVSVFSLAIWGGVIFFKDTMSRYLPQGDAWYWPLLAYFLWFIAILATTVLVFFSFAVIGNLIASPFNELLSEKTEEFITGEKTEIPFSLRQFGSDAVRIMSEESRKMAVFISGMFFLFLLNLLPGIGSLAYAILSAVWTVFFLAIEYTWYVFARKRLRFADQRRFITSHLPLVSGFGCGLLCLLAIPLLQLFTIPLGVIGATQLVLETFPQNIAPEPSSAKAR